ncbi:hypothetical protein VaNZ11_016729 [Volvox africanus]|uniref:Secreted protein n=1 Tax=Volvox africanus TaxID=51714 RepID=A0ABQ5SNC6_9CHLO|nr:hypothetical protein VaNZ11_016729 [Volvox africanus]
MASARASSLLPTSLSTSALTAGHPGSAHQVQASLPRWHHCFVTLSGTSFGPKPKPGQAVRRDILEPPESPPPRLAHAASPPFPWPHRSFPEATILPTCCSSLSP